ncbi:DedA family protein [Streptomyces sp. NPDC002276]
MDIGALIEAAGWWAYVVVFAVTVGETSAFVGVLLPGETAILVAAAMAASGHLDVAALAVVVVVGGIVGDSLGYALGRWYERRPSGRRLLDRIRPGSRAARAQEFLVRHGGTAVFTGRFIGFVRTFLPFAAGVSGMPYRRFVLYSSVASVVWGIGNVLLGYFAGAAVTNLLHSIGLVGAVTLAALVLVLLVATYFIRLLRVRKRSSRRPAPSEVVASGGPRVGVEREQVHAAAATTPPVRKG